MASEHTPGPWTSVATGHQMREYYSQPFSVMSVEIWRNGENSLIAGCFGDGGLKAAEANARLISAAPDLLEALIGVVKVADRSTVEFDAAHAAIAKALGR